MRLEELYEGSSFDLHHCKELSKVVDRLKYLASGGIDELMQSTGICNDLRRNTRVNLGWELIQKVCQDKVVWYTENPNYPVPRNEEGLWEGVTGERRRELCKLLAEFIKSSEDYKEQNKPEEKVK